MNKACGLMKPRLKLIDKSTIPTVFIGVMKIPPVLPHELNVLGVKAETRIWSDYVVGFHFFDGTNCLAQHRIVYTWK